MRLVPTPLAIAITISLFCVAAAIAQTISVTAQATSVTTQTATVTEQTATIPLWPGTAPGSENWTRHEVATTLGDNAVVRNVATPTLTIYRPALGKANGSAVIICPGGGFYFLTMDSEGSEVAEWLAARGVTAFVLKYRLSSSGDSTLAFRFGVIKFFIDRSLHAIFGKENTLVEDPRIAHIRPLAAADGQRAIALVREQANQWALDSHRIGMLGFSAGGAVVNDVATHYDTASRPDFVASIYSIGLNTMSIPTDAPPLFVAAAADDTTVPPALSIDMDAAWRDSGHHSELHIYDNGGHGFGIRKQQKLSDRWIDDYERWLQSQRIIGAQ